MEKATKVHLDVVCRVKVTRENYTRIIYGGFHRIIIVPLFPITLTEQIVVNIGFFPLVYMGSGKILVFPVSKSDARTVNIVTSPILA